MRILFAINPEKAHLLTLVPLAWALHTAGHEVRVASQPAFAGLITRAGLTAVPVGRDADLWQLLARDPRNPGWTWQPAYGLPTPYDVADHPERASRQYLTDGYAEVLRDWHRPANLPTIAGLVAFARHWRPDLVIWEPLAFAGSIAAKACGAAHARILWSLDAFGRTRDHFLRAVAAAPPGDTADPLADWLAGYGRKHGFEFTADMITGQFTIDQAPASIRMAADVPYLSMRYVPYGGPAAVPTWLWPPPERPRVALTMGLSLTDHGAGYGMSIQDILDALADLDLELVATIPEAEQRKLSRIPDNARLVPYAPLDVLAPTCGAVINHAGFGTVLTTARHAVPQLALPWDFDAPALASRLAAQGTALATRADQATGATVRESVLRLLHKPGFRDRAGQLRDELLAMPTPRQVVPRLEELTTEHRAAVRG